MKKTAHFTASLMSDAKWRKFFNTTAQFSDRVFRAQWKLIDEAKPLEGGLPRPEDIWESEVDGCLGGPIAYRQIEWIELPREVPSRHYSNAPIARKLQDLDSLRVALGAAQFPLTETNDGLRISGYHR